MAKHEFTLEELRRYVRSDGQRLLDQDGYNSIGIAKKDSGDLYVLVTAEEGLGLEEASLGLENESINGHKVPIEIEHRSYRPAYTVVGESIKPERKRRLDPMRPGCSVSHPTGTAGTLGAIVHDNQTGAACILSNWHVLDGKGAEIGDEIVQPGPFDDNQTHRNGAGRLLRSHLGLAGDCAIATIENRGFERRALDILEPVSRLGRPELGDLCVKSGRTTGVTYGRVARVEITVQITYDVGSRKIGAFELVPDPDYPADDDEISKGGDSGSVWMAVGEDGSHTGVMVGLHFGGETFGPDRALACYADRVFEKLEISLQSSPDKAVFETGDGMGYDEAFLGEDERIPMPTAAPSVLRGLYLLNGSPVIPYTHFSLILDKDRALTRAVGWNIDGSRTLRLPRSSKWFKEDERIESAFQTNNDAYYKNKLDRGHIARRADLCWGTEEEARRANKESFLWPNIVPQHERFNQSSKAGLWGELEDAVFEDAAVQGLRVSVFGGPVLSPKDHVYRQSFRIPKAFWKLICYREANSGDLVVRAFMLTQADLLHDIEAVDLDEFELYEVSVEELEKRTKLSFGDLGTTASGRCSGLSKESSGHARVVESRAHLRQILVA